MTPVSAINIDGRAWRITLATPLTLIAIRRSNSSAGISQRLPGVLIVATDMLRKSMGDEADHYPKPADWATTAAPFMTALTAANNGESLTTP